jgi:hypothetical protein
LLQLSYALRFSFRGRLQTICGGLGHLSGSELKHHRSGTSRGTNSSYLHGGEWIPMKAPALALLLLSAFFVSACEDSEPVRPPDARTASPVNFEGREVWAYQDARLLISDLNDHLEEAGAPTCAMRNPDLQTGYAETVPNQGAAVCEFNEGTPLYALIVRNGEDTYERHFGRQFGPNVYLWGPTWFLITSMPPPEVREVIRRDLGASE